ncbi:MAG TPA: hypothetical protein VKZ53_17920 [Candidatus Angelobacter sp.]|nr:hypothetical protein [Candidatus Angelobacter sp.]
MDNLTKLGRIFFAIPMIVFGIQYAVYGRFTLGLPPVPPWTPGSPILAYLTGAALAFAGICIAVRWNARLSATFLGLFFLLCVLFLHGQRPGPILREGNARTVAFEPLALAALAFILAGALGVERRSSQTWGGATNLLAKLGPYLFGFCMIVFGVQHFMYAAFIANIVPSWIPGHIFWVYLTGTGMIVAGLSIALNIFARLSAAGLGLMFLLWFIVLHTPRVIAQLHHGDEWTSAFIALGMCGGCFVIAAAGLPKRGDSWADA